ncbi:MAG: sugar phosphate isomerase/epimerase [Clostridia bacterium]|nr:sugar phosphate isomerase/epimerase [Clostridia bacterium]
MTKVGLSLFNRKGLDKRDEIAMIADAGFDSTFLMFTGDDPIADLCRECRGRGLEVETVHLPWGSANELWACSDRTEAVMDDYRRRINVAADCGIPVAVMHVTIGNTAPDPTPRGVENFLEVCGFAENAGVKIAFENLEPLPHLGYLMPHVPSYHGFCWDVGHNSCYSPETPMFALYGDRLLCLHLHDNLGVTRPGEPDYRDDRHYLPFGGVIDWNWFADRFFALGKNVTLMIEADPTADPACAGMSDAEAVREAYSRACRLRDGVSAARAQTESGTLR